jgi:hypothetical protein
MESTALEVGIGLAVIFFLTATVVTGVNEGITRAANLRSKALWKTLGTLLDPKAGKKPIGLGFIKDLSPKGYKRPTVPEAPTTANSADEKKTAAGLVDTPSIWALEYTKSMRETKVWKIPTKVFTAALLELATIKGGGGSLTEKVDKLTDEYGSTPFGQFLSANADSITKDVDKFFDHVGAWFDGQMERLTDSYRRVTKYLLAALGLLAAILFNVDAVGVASGLAGNADARQAIVLLADDLGPAGLPCPTDGENGGEDSSPTTADRQSAPADPEHGDSPTPGDEGEEEQGTVDLKCAADNLASIENLGIAYPGTANWRSSWSNDGDDLGQHTLHVLGLLVTAFAVGLGGPFWFDTVGVLAGLRRRQT